MHFNRQYDQIFFCDTGETEYWQRCVIAGCRNLVCKNMSDVLCYPHGIHYGIFTEEQFEADRHRRKSE